MANNTKICRYCRSEIDAKASVCPICRRSLKQGNDLLLGLGIAGAIIVGFILLCIYIDGSSNKSTPIKPSRSSVVANSDNDTAESNVEAEQPESPKVPKEFSNALKKAERYAKNQYMSKARIYTQLTSEYGEAFSDEAATYAIENMTADFKANALYKAKRYSDNQHMSKAHIYKQLTSEYGEKFTPEEAQYAVDNLVADYKENALYKARSYQDSQAMSPDRIYKQLTSEYGEQFTEEEAQYAIDNLK